jgi:DNA repair protein RadC
MTLRESLTPEERPRERLARLGTQTLTDAELLALLIGSGFQGRNAVAVACDLLATCGGLRGLQRQSIEQLKRLPGLGLAKACVMTAAFELGLRASLAELRTGEPLTRFDLVRNYCRLALSNLDIEHCLGLFLDSQNRLIHTVELARGTLTQTAVYVREVAKTALQHHASALILAHNHPSGSAAPSPADISLTHELREALGLVDVLLVDHVIVAGPNVVSLSELGFL